MPRIACIVAGAAAVAITVSAAKDAIGAPRKEHRQASRCACESRDGVSPD